MIVPLKETATDSILEIGHYLGYSKGKETGMSQNHVFLFPIVCIYIHVLYYIRDEQIKHRRSCTQKNIAHLSLSCGGEGHGPTNTRFSK